jgi:hypothetical protein
VFVGADLSEAILDGATLDGANFCGASLKRVDFTKAKFAKCPDFKHADLQGATFCLRQLTGCNLSGVAWRDMKILKGGTDCPEDGQGKVDVGRLQVAATKQDPLNWQPSPEQCW